MWTVVAQSFDQIETWSNGYLMQSMVSGPPATLPEYTAGSSVSAFASMNRLLASLRTGIGAGLFTGTGVDQPA